MKFIQNIPYLIIAGFIYLLIYSSCANQGMPSGGPRDSLPPVLVRTEPSYGELNYNGDEVRLAFDEYIVSDQVMDALVVSPPLQKRPSIKMKSKILIVQFNEDLRDSVTYSLDFKNSVEDNNERNPYKNLRFTFSTWNVLDTLRVAGMVKNAFNLEPVEKSLVILHKDLGDSAIYNDPPDYIAKTDERGIFLFDNLAPGKYHIFSINDANSDMKYNKGIEEIAFIDTLIIPKARFVEKHDTIISGTDSLLISGHTQFSPEPIYLRQFMDDVFSQFLTSAERETKYKCRFIFEEPVKDTFGVRLLNARSDDWYIPEPNPSMDSITLWISDTLIAKLDTINLEVLYNQIDSSGSFFIQKDTLNLAYTEEKKEPVKKRRRDNDEKETVEIQQFTITDNLKSSGFDLNRPVLLQIPEPVKYFHSDQVHLYLDADTTGTPLDFSFEKDTTAWRKYKLSYKWEPNTEYRLEVDSAACENIYGITNRRLMKKFKTQKEDYYGALLLQVKNIPCPVILQLLKDDDNESLVKKIKMDKDGLAVFEYLAPAKYKLKAIYDSNGNGKWDAGNFPEKVQPENVAYFQMVIKVRSNWEQQENWDLTVDPTYPKDIYDKDLEEQKKKEQEEQRSQQSRSSNNSGFNSGGLRSINRQ